MTTSRKSLSTGFVLILLVLIGLAVWVFIPAPKPPSQAEAEAIILKAIAEQSQGLVRLVSFDKTDDRPSVERGRSLHRVMFRGEIEFIEDCQWDNTWDDFWRGDFHARKLTDSPDPFGSRKVKQGDRIRFSGAILFQREAGTWKGKIDPEWSEIL